MSTANAPASIDALEKMLDNEAACYVDGKPATVVRTHDECQALICAECAKENVERMAVAYIFLCVGCGQNVQPTSVEMRLV